MRSLTSFLVEWVLGTIAAALWCTVGSYAYAAVWCGKNGPCWAFIGAVWLYACFAMLLYPAVVTLSQVAVSACGKTARERLEGARALITAALTICISISMSTAIYYSAREITLSVESSHGVMFANFANASIRQVNASTGNSSIFRDDLSVTDNRPGRRQLDDSYHNQGHGGGQGSSEGHHQGEDWQDIARGRRLPPTPPPMALDTRPLYDNEQAFRPPRSGDSGTWKCQFSQFSLLYQQHDRRQHTPGSAGIGANIGSSLCPVLDSPDESGLHGGGEAFADASPPPPPPTSTRAEDDEDELVGVGGIATQHLGDDDIGGDAVAANSSSSGDSRLQPRLSMGYALLVPSLVMLLAATFTFWAALLTSVTARRLALHESGQRPIGSAYHRTLLTCVGGAMASPVGYAWNLALSQLIFAPLLTVKTRPAEAVLLNLEIARAIFFLAFVGGLYLLFLRRVNKQLRGRHHIWARSIVLVHDGACAIVASGLANVVDYFCNFFLFGMWRSHGAGLGLDFGIALVVVGIGGVIEALGCLVPAAGSDIDKAVEYVLKRAERQALERQGDDASRTRCARCSLPPWHAFALNVVRWLASYCVWYPTTDAFTYINGYEEANANGLLVTVGYAVAATIALVVAAVLTTSRAHLLAQHEASMRHVQLTEHGEPGTAPCGAGASGKLKPDHDMLSAEQV